MRSYWEVLQNRQFLVLYLGQIFSRLGDGISRIVITWTVWERTSSTTLVALALILQTVPPTIFGPTAGIVADRRSDRNIMVTVDALRALATLGLAFLGYSGHLNHWALMIGGFLLISGGTFFAPARANAVRRLVPQESLQTANGLIQGSFMTGILVGQVIGGWMLTVTNPGTLILFDAVTYVASVATLLLLRGMVNRPAQARAPFVAQMREGFAVVQNVPALLWVTATFGIGTMLAGGVVQVGLTALMSQMGAGSKGLSMIALSTTLGTIIGSFLCGRTSSPYKARTVMLGWLGEGVLLLLYAVSPNLPLFVAISCLIGVSSAYVNVPTQTLIQMYGGANTGKVFSFWSISIWLGETVSLAVLAPMLGVMSTSLMFVVVGAVLTGLSMLGALKLWLLSDGVKPAASLVGGGA